MLLLDEIEVKDLLEHCLDQVRRPLNSKNRFEHYVLLQCLKGLSVKDFERYKEEFKYIIKE